MAGKTAADIEADAAASEDMAWDDDAWEDNGDSPAADASESQQILRGGERSPVLDPDADEDDIETEIRANLSSKITSKLHAYKVAALALIVALVSFTINTVSTPPPAHPHFVLRRT
jgi:hypothetical protein